MTEKILRKLLNEQKTELIMYMDWRFAEQDKRIDKKFKEQDKAWDGKLEKTRKEVIEDFDRRTGVLYEAFHVDLQKIAENVVGIHERLDRLERWIKKELNKIWMYCRSL